MAGISIMWTELRNLKESNEFLNLLLDNINSAVLIADENLRIHQFNKSFLDLFDRATETVLEASFGDTVGCVNAILENKACGATSQCSQCVLRSSLIHNLIDRAPVDNQPLNRVFLNQIVQGGPGNSQKFCRGGIIAVSHGNGLLNGFFLCILAYLS